MPRVNASVWLGSVSHHLCAHSEQAHVKTSLTGVRVIPASTSCVEAEETTRYQDARDASAFSVLSPGLKNVFRRKKKHGAQVDWKRCSTEENPIVSPRTSSHVSLLGIRTKIAQNKLSFIIPIYEYNRFLIPHAHKRTKKNKSHALSSFLDLFFCL